MKPEPKNKIYAFIDSQNLNLGIKNDVKRRGKKIYKGWKLDFIRFKKYLEDRYKVSKCFLFIGLIPENATLYTRLQNAGYTLIFKPTLVIKEGGDQKVKGNVDAELVLHSMIEYSNYDKAIIVSGDGDFHCLIEYLEKKKKLKLVMIPNRASYSSLLKKFSKYLRFVNEMKAKLKFRK